MRHPTPSCRITYRLSLLLVVVGVLCPSAELLHGGEKDKQPFIALKHPFVVSCLAFSPDGKTLATGCFSVVADPEIKEVPCDVLLWDTTTGKGQESLKGHVKSVISVAFSPDGKTIASASADKTVKLWDIASGKEKVSFKLPFRPDCLAFSSDLKTFATGEREEGVVKLWDLATGKEVATLGRHDNGTSTLVRFSLTFSGDGKYLASASKDAHPEIRRKPHPAEVKVWDVTKRKEIVSLPARTGSNPLAWSPDSVKLAYVGKSAGVRLWDVRTRKGHEVDEVDIRGSDFLSFGAEGKILAGAYYGDIFLWNKQVGFVKSGFHPISCVAISPDSKTLAAGGVPLTEYGRRGEVRLWDIAKARKPIELLERK